MSKRDKIAHLEQKIKMLEKENNKLLWENRSWQDVFLYRQTDNLTLAEVWADIRQKKRILEERIGVLDNRIAILKAWIAVLFVLLIAESIYLFTLIAR